MPPILVFLLFQIPFIAYIFIPLLRYSLFLIIPTSLTELSSSPSYRLIYCRLLGGRGQGYAAQGSFWVNSTLVFWDICVCGWYMWVMGDMINLVYTHVENLVVVSFQVDIWDILLSCNNKKCIINMMPMRSLKVMDFESYGCRERNSRVYVIMFLHK